ncbi:MAG: hypothetical protein FK733_19255 [Asgard group archaeon]|nr:hypothetical protein [Asgard group archaeon]
MLDNGEFRKAAEKIKKLLKSTKINERERLRLRINEGNVYCRLKQGEKALAHVEKLIEEINDEKYYEEFILALIAKSNALYSLSHYIETQEIIEEALIYFDNLTDEKKENLQIIKGELLLRKSYCFYQVGNFSETESLTKEALNIFDKIDYSIGIADAFCNLGLVERNVDKAIEYLEESLAIYKDLKNDFQCAIIYHYLGRKYNSKGEPYRALEYMNKSLPMIYDINDDYRVGVTLFHMAPILIEIGEYDKAKEYALKCLDSFEKLGSIATIGMVYFHLTRIALYQGDIDEAIRRKNTLFDLRKRFQNPNYYRIQYDLLDALILMNSKKSTDLDKAEEIFRELKQEDNLPWVHRFEIDYYLCEILLLKYQKTNQPELLEEIDLLSQELVNFGDIRGSSRLKINGYNLRLLTLFVRNQNNDSSIDTNEAKILLNNLYKLAEKSGLNTSLDKFVLQYVELMNENQAWIEFMQK